MLLTIARDRLDESTASGREKECLFHNGVGLQAEPVHAAEYEEEGDKAGGCTG